MTEITEVRKSVRVANFSGLDLDVEYHLDFGSEDYETILRRISYNADLPYVFVVGKEQARRILELLSALKSNRSPCYPYALFSIDGANIEIDDDTVDVVNIDGTNPGEIRQHITAYATSRLSFDGNKLRVPNSAALPQKTEVTIIGAGITGLYAAGQLKEAGLSFCILDKAEKIGGIWSAYANSTSQVNTSECAYRLFEKETRSNRDHSFTREILEDLTTLSNNVSDQIFLDTEATKIEKTTQGYRVEYVRRGERAVIESQGILLAINDRVGPPREITYKNQSAFQGKIVSGFSDNAKGTDWRDKNVVIVGMGAFAVENARTALEGGAKHVTVVCRRHGTICPKIIDYLNFSTPYNEEFQHDKKSNTLNMMYWKKLYDLSGATQPECWMGKVKHDGHTISVSDIWFIAHHLKKLETRTGEVTELTENGAIINGEHQIDADVIVNCVGFEKNSTVAKTLSGYSETYNNNFLDKNFMYLADAYIDADAFNSMFGSSVLEMSKFYIYLFMKYFNNPEFDEMLSTDGIEKISIEDRKWSNYIQAAMSLLKKYPEINKKAQELVNQRTKNFHEFFDLETYIKGNKTEWIQLHSTLAGRPIKEEECLPYVFERLLKKKR